MFCIYKLLFRCFLIFVLWSRTSGTILHIVPAMTTYNGILILLGLENMEKLMWSLGKIISWSLYLTFPYKVVSEVLFPGADSPVQPRTPHSPISPIQTSPVPCHSPAPPTQHSSQPHEVIGHLMQEAQGEKATIINPQLVPVSWRDVRVRSAVSTF